MKVIDSLGERPHFLQDCWCKPYVCDGCEMEHHRMVQLSTDCQPRMAAFSDQRVTATY